MTFPQSLSTKFGVLAAGVLYAGATFGLLAAPAPAEARSSGHYYTVELAQPTAERTIVAGGVAWSCEGTRCVAAKGSSRPMRMCRALQRDTGEIRSFTTDGKALAADRLAKCNS